MNRSARVAFIVPYLGPWPKWSRLFFESVKANPCVDMFLFCETAPPFPLPSNVSAIQTSKAQLLERLTQATGLQMSDISGHKLCDFRPFFGLCFADVLCDYEFWGFCDVDLMLGDLGKLIGSRDFDHADIFTAHDSQVAGHFTILRNKDFVNRVGFEIEDWSARCLNPQTMLVEELHFSKALEAHGEIDWNRPNPLVDELKAPFCRFGITFGFGGEVAHLNVQAPALVEWHDGRVIYSDMEGTKTEVLYVHFMGLKRWWHWLSFEQRSGPGVTHRFSRIGYGGPDNAAGLERFPWRQIYAMQVLLQNGKSYLGGLSRRLLPGPAFLRLRRLVFGKGRF